MPQKQDVPRVLAVSTATGVAAAAYGLVKLGKHLLSTILVVFLQVELVLI